MKLLHKLTLMACGALALPLQATSLSEVDFTQKQTGQGYVFAPLKGTTSNRGVFWYTSYDQTVSPATRINSALGRITVRAMPTARENGVYQNFVDQTGALDERENLLPTDAVVCEANAALIAKLQELNFNYQLDKTVGGYPGLCFLNITYLRAGMSAAESQLIDFANQNPVMYHQFSVSGDAQAAVFMDAQTITTQLLDAGTLTAVAPTAIDNTAYYTGDLYKIAFDTSNMDAQLFRSDNAPGSVLKFDDWKSYVSLFSLKLEAPALVPQQLVDQQIEVVAGSTGNIEVVVDTRTAN